MFRDGQYLEIIKVSESCMATAIITVKEKSVEIDKKTILTNKWLNLEDWSSLYKIVQRAVLRNSKITHGDDGRKSLARRKSTQTMDVIYSYEAPKDASSLPTIRARVSPAKRRHNEENPPKPPKSHPEKSSCSPDVQDSPETKVRRLMEGNDEEYVPPEGPNRLKAQEDLQYVPSRKSFLKRMRSEKSSPADAPNRSETPNRSPYVPNSVSSLRKKSKHEMYEPSGTSSLPPAVTEAYVPSSKGSAINCDEYTPTSGAKLTEDTAYVPISLASLKKKSRHEMYEPWEGTSLSSEVAEAYVPSSKGSSTRIEEYEPDFSTMSVDPDVVYVPSAKKIMGEEISEEDMGKGRGHKEGKKHCESRKKSLVNDAGKREL
ncbi:uncharacterized protein LOC107036922 [Diachasma alloeum]|uniref:uncharacterized protein LOC107036922 n=1 Tax=Diachasma alloeum TaxID=454923 RepID=UPI0010FB86A0|nr:uncharacterized protein LOC107036922 [Diachasma alloeum]